MLEIILNISYFGRGRFPVHGEGDDGLTEGCGAERLPELSDRPERSCELYLRYYLLSSSHQSGLFNTLLAIQDDLPFGVEPVTYGEDIEDDYDDMEDLDPTQFMEEITEEVDTALVMDVDVSAEGEDMQGLGSVDHIEIEEPPETQEIAEGNTEDLVEADFVL